MEKRITVFTPTYNRAYILGKCYQSLVQQTCKDFEWLIIDDGSTDGTEKLVRSWQAADNGFEIRYIYKENGGLHTGYNTAIANMTTELSVCIDSDDSMPADGVERILTHWDRVDEPDVAGLVGLDLDEQGNVIGRELSEGKAINAATLLCVPGTGDKKYVVRNDLLRKIAPMPVFPGEKNFNPHYYIIRLSTQYRFVPVNECFCIVEYQPDGMTANVFKQYCNSPNSFAELRLAILNVQGMTWKYRVKTTIHYVASCILAGRKDCIGRAPNKVAATLAIPAGVLLAAYIKKKAK